VPQSIISLVETGRLIPTAEQRRQQRCALRSRRTSPTGCHPSVAMTLAIASGVCRADTYRLGDATSRASFVGAYWDTGDEERLEARRHPPPTVPSRR
jgi:hypothetical protein